MYYKRRLIVFADLVIKALKIGLKKSDQPPVYQYGSNKSILSVTLVPGAAPPPPPRPPPAGGLILYFRFFV